MISCQRIFLFERTRARTHTVANIWLVMKLWAALDGHVRGRLLASNASHLADPALNRRSKLDVFHVKFAQKETVAFCNQKSTKYASNSC